MQGVGTIMGTVVWGETLCSGIEVIRSLGVFGFGRKYEAPKPGVIETITQVLGASV